MSEALFNENVPCEWNLESVLQREAFSLCVLFLWTQFIVPRMIF